MRRHCSDRSCRRPCRPGAALPAQLAVVANSEQIGFFMQDCSPIAAYRALMTDPRFPETRQQEVIVPLAISE